MLVKWDPYTDLEKTVNSFFGRPLGLRPLWDDQNGEQVAWKPPVNVYEDKETLSIDFQLPGIDLKDVTVSVKDHHLEVRGERKAEEERDQDGYHIREAHYGTFARNFTLPTDVNPDEAKASYDKGVLTIRIPKQEKAKPKNIQIEAK